MAMCDTVTQDERRKMGTQEYRGTDGGAAGVVGVMAVVIQRASGTAVTLGPEINDAGTIEKNGTVGTGQSTHPRARKFKCQAPGERLRVT